MFEFITVTPKKLLKGLVNQDMDKIRKLIDRGVNIDYKYKYGLSPLH